MKNTLDVSGSGMNKEINSIARRVIDSEYSRDMLRNEIDTRYNYISNNDKEILINRIIQRSYDYAWSVEERIMPLMSLKGDNRGVPAEESAVDERRIRKTYAHSLFSFVIKTINGKTFSIRKDERMGKRFYALCLETASPEIRRGVEDAGLFEIYLKQAVIIIRKSGLFFKKRGVARVQNGGIPAKNIFLELFYSFWDRVEWEEIFPSNPSAAKSLKRDRNILIDLILRHDGAFRIDEIANEFFEFVGFSGKNNLYLISFLDFSLFTWLSHFGILRYLNGRDDEPVCVEITEMGRSLLRILQGN